MLKVCINPSFPLPLSAFFALVCVISITSTFIFCPSFSFSLFRHLHLLLFFLSTHPELSSSLLADRELLFGKGQLMIGSCVCSDFRWIPSNNPALVFVIVMKDRKKDSRDSSFSLILVTHSWGNTFFFLLSFRPLPNYSCILLSQPHSPWRGSETEEAQSR